MSFYENIFFVLSYSGKLSQISNFCNCTVLLACSTCLFHLLFFEFFFGHSFSKDKFLKVIPIPEVKSVFSQGKELLLQITELFEHYLYLWDHIWSRKQKNELFLLLFCLLFWVQKSKWNAYSSCFQTLL